MQNSLFSGNKIEQPVKSTSAISNGFKCSTSKSLRIGSIVKFGLNIKF